MKKWLSLVALMALAFTLQSSGLPSDCCTHSDKAELKVGKKGEISLPDKVWAGSNVLKGGRYLIHCEHKSTEHHEMVLTRLATSSPYSTAPTTETRETVRVQCRVQSISNKVERTSVLIAERNGERFLEKIMIRGENVEHLFD